ncbi:Uncharacterised protein [Salmonella enterica subsp. enterica serovar Typhimurium str. DT104]|nr:Uncharacterised protein [Salmonella enterica subsp. enterica serovar Typhimurium str. DT104]
MALHQPLMALGVRLHLVLCEHQDSDLSLMDLPAKCQIQSLMQEVVLHQH